MREKNRKFADLSLHSVLVVFPLIAAIFLPFVLFVPFVPFVHAYLLPAARNRPEKNPLRIVLGIRLGLKQFIYSFICNHLSVCFAISATLPRNP